MRVGVIDAGVAIAWIRGATRSRKVLDRLYRARRNGSVSLVMSTVNLAEVLIHTAKYARASGVDPVTFLTASGLRIHPPDEAIARRVARLETSLADGFAAATGARARRPVSYDRPRARSPAPASAARHHQLLTSQRSRSRIPWPNSRNISLNRTRRAALSIMRVKTRILV